MNYFEELKSIRDIDDDYRSCRGDTFVEINSLSTFKQTKFYNDLRHKNISKEVLLNILNNIHFSTTILSLIMEKNGYHFTTTELLQFINNTNDFDSKDRLSIVFKYYTIPTMQEFVDTINSIETFIDITNLLSYLKEKDILPFFNKTSETPYELCEAIINYGIRNIKLLTCRYKTFNHDGILELKVHIKQIEDFFESCMYFRSIYNIQYFIDFIDAAFVDNHNKIKFLIDLTIFSLKTYDSKPIITLENITKVVKQCVKWNNGKKIINSIDLNNRKGIDRFFDLTACLVKNTNKNFDFIVENLILDLVPYFNREYTINYILSIIIKYYNNDEKKINKYFDSLLQSGIAIKGLHAKELFENNVYPTSKIARLVNSKTTYADNYIFSKDMLQDFEYMLSIFEIAHNDCRSLDSSILKAMVALHDVDLMIEFALTNYNYIRKVFGFYYGLHPEIVDIYDALFNKESFIFYYPRLDIGYIVRSKHLHFDIIQQILDTEYYSADILFDLIVKNNRKQIHNLSTKELIQFYGLVQDVGLSASIFSYATDDRSRVLTGKGALKDISKDEFLKIYYETMEEQDD